MKISNEEDPRILCPVCGDDYVHPIGTRIFPVKGDTNLSVDKTGVNISASDAVKQQRGISIVIQFCCESGHVWDSEMKFHKGMTYVKTTQLEDQEIDPEKGPQTIWRD